MTLLSALIDAVEADLQDSSNTYFAAADIERWLRDAIDDYSQHFPRIDNTDINTSANDREYDLPADFIDPISVEYPQGEDPPEYLKRRPYTHPHFWSDDGYYDILPRHDTGDVDELYISEKPGASETIRIHYHAKHDSTITTSETPTVPEEHHHILRAYARWQAAKFLAAAEEANPTSNSSLLMSILATNAGRWQREYNRLLREAIQAEHGRSQIVNWAADQPNDHPLTRIY